MPQDARGVVRRTPCSILGLFLLAASPVESATRTWSGAAIGNPLWSNPTNWGLILPANGDSLFFPLNAGNKSSVNNLAITNYGTLFFAGSNYTFSGGTLTLSGGLVATNANGTNTLATPLLLRASQTFANGASFGGVLQIANSLDLNGNTLTFQGGGVVRALSPILGTGDLIKAGFGDLFLQAGNPFSGTLSVALGNVYVRHPLALGDTNFPVVVTNLTRRLFLGTNVVVTNKSLQLGQQAELWGEGGTNGWNGPIALNGTDAFLRLDNGGTLRLSGAISGAGNWHVVGPGTAILDGPQANTASGTWDLAEGAILLLNKAPGLSAGQRFLIAEGSTIRLLASDQLSNTRSVVLSDGTLDLNGFSDAIAFPTDSTTNGAGRILFGSSGTNALTFGSTTVTSVFSGTLSGAGDLVKIGGSTHILRGTNNSTGDTIINGAGGVLAVDGRIAGPTLVTNGMLTGTGRVGVVRLNGANAILNPGLGTNRTGRLTLLGASSWLNGRLQLELNGLAPITQHDQIQVGAALNITNCTLQVFPGFAPLPGDSFTIINNATVLPINGVFAGLPEGAVLDAGGTLLRISYLGGTGNDVTLTVVTSPATGVTRQWNGGGTGSFWLTPLNWAAGARPQGGDSLYFPPGAPKPVNTNDFPPLFLDSILIGASDYDLRGNGVTLLGGLTATNVGGAATVRTPLVLAAHQTFAQTRAGGTLTIPAPIDVGIYQLSISATGSVITSGFVSGPGSLIKNGPGQLSIPGTNSLGRALSINQGALVVDGAVTAPLVLLSPGASLGGSGFIHRLQAAGRVAPGQNSANPLTFDSEFQLTNGAVLALGLRTVGPGERPNQIVVTNAANTVILSNATLEIHFPTPPSPGQSFTLIDSAGTSPVLGTFAGLPEGATFAVSNVICRISYAAGTGNDVVLTALSPGPSGLERVWTGAAFPDVNWSNPSNWSGHVVPGSGDGLVFPGTALGKTNFNDLGVDVVWQNLRFTTGAANYRISGPTNSILLLAEGIAVTNASAGPTLLLPVQLVADQTFTNAGIGLTLTGMVPSLTSVLTDGHQLTLGNLPGALTVVDGAIAGDGGLIKTGDGTAKLAGANRYSGPTFVQGGAVLVANDQAFGGTNNGTTVSAGASVVFALGDRAVGEPLALAGTLDGGLLPNETWSGPVSLIAPGAILAAQADAGATGALRVSGSISGANGFTKTGLGRVTLAASNSFDGPVVVSTGTLLLGNQFALGATAGGITVNTGARLELVAGLPPVVGEPLNLAGTLAASDHPGHFVWDGDVALNSPAAIIEVQPVQGNSSVLEVSGQVSGNGGLLKTGAGELHLQQDNTYQGSTRIAAGTLAINGNQIDSPVVISNGASLAGNGQCGAITSIGGSVSPGVFGNEGVLRVAGGVSLDAASTLVIDLIDAARFDQLRVFGAIDLGGAALAVNLGYTPALGDSFEIIRNDGLDPVVGTLAGVPQDGILKSGGFAFRVNYTGGDGNDVVLTALFPAPTGLTREWTGAGLPKTNWSNAANWLNQKVPLGGDDAFFPGAIDNPRKTNFFDLSGRTLNRLTFGGDQSRYRIFGTNNLRLTGGIVVSNATFGPSFSLPIELASDQIFSNAGPSGLRVTGLLLSSNQLTWDGAGSMTVDGSVSGTGPIRKRGAGSLTLNGSSTFTGEFTLDEGAVLLGNNSALGSVAGETVLGPGAQLGFVGAARTVAEPLTLAGTLNGQARTGDRWTGPVSLAGSGGTVNVETNGALTLSGALDGNGALHKTGRGTLLLDATNANTGETFVQAGTLFISGIHTGSLVVVQSGGVLGGTGVVGSVSVAGGTITPNGIGSAGELLVGSDLTLDSASNVRVDLGGLAAGVEFDRLRAAGGVHLGGARLVVGVRFLPSVGAAFEILRKESPGLIDGTFAGLAQGATFNTGILTWRISYTGGDGNDVVLTLVNTGGVPSERVWTGAGAPNTNWSNPYNWSDDLPPGPGDALIFPGGAQGTFNFNDLPPDLFFDSLRFSTGFITYAIRSAADLSLHSGITLSNASLGTPFLGFTTRMLDDQSFRADGNSLILGGLATEGHQATIEGTGVVSVSTFFINNQVFNPVISGGGSLRKRGPGTLALGGTNTYTGATLVEAGVVELQRSLALGSPVADTTVSPDAIVQMRFGSLSVPEPLALGGTLVVSDFAQSNVWSGPITLTAPAATLHVGSNNASLRVTGVISGSGGFVKTGPGQLSLEADNTYSGATLVQLGSLAISNSHLAGPITVTGTNSALALAGVAGAVTSQGGLLHAGPPVATGANILFNTAGTPGAVSVGALTLDAATRLVVDIAGLVAGSGFDQWRVSGPIALGNASLILNLGAVTPVGSAFTILRQDTAGAVSGTFAGLPEGTEFVRGLYRWRISYIGGDGNDVVLTVIGQNFPGLVWDGGGVNSNWTTAVNWVGDIAPLTGADLVFPTESANKTNVNDFAPGMVFSSLRFTSAGNNTIGHRLSGNSLLLTNGLAAETNAGAITLGLALTLGGPAPWNAAGGTSLTLTGAVNNAGFNLSLAGPGSFVFREPISGGGGLVSSAGFVSLRTNNSFLGPTLVSNGAVRVDTGTPFGAPGNVVTVESGGRLQLQSATNLSNPLVLRGRLEALLSNRWSGPITVSGTNAALGSSGNGPLAIEGPISGSGELTLVGGSLGRELVLNGTNNYTGTMRLASGILLVNGRGTGSALHLATNQFFAPTLLAGTGTVGTLLAGGTVAPGLPTNAGILNVAGSLALSNTAVFDVQVNGPDAGTGHDQLRVTGDVLLDNASLQLTQPPAFRPNVGDTFVIIRNDGPSPVGGSFAGLPEGGFITNIAVFQISYLGGDGNDVALRVTAQKGLVSQWTGNGGDNNWSTGANWLAGVPPDPGDSLIFSNGVPNRVAQNDLPPGTTFSRLRFLGFNSGQPFFLGGNPITLTDGIEGFFSGSNVVSMPLTLGASQTFSNTFGLLVFPAGVANGGHNLALDGAGTFDFVGPISGAGGLSWSNHTSSFGFLNLRTNNPYSGPTAFDGPIAILAYRDGAFGDASSPTYIGPSVQCLLQAPMSLGEPVILAGRLDFADGSNAMTAPLTFAGSNLTLCATGPRLEYDGPLLGDGSVQICGVSTNFFNAGGDFHGLLEVYAGQQNFIGDYPDTQILVRGGSSFSTTVAGTGRVGGIVAAGGDDNSVIAPGLNGPGVLTVNGPFIVRSNITLRLELNGTSPGTGHDQLVVAGPVALTNCTLELAFGFAPGPGSAFTLLRNDGGTPVAGTFENLPEGAFITNGAAVFRLTYAGGDGNDIVLVSPGAPPSMLTSLSLASGNATLVGMGIPNAAYGVEASTDLVTWTPLATVIANPSGLYQFIDRDAGLFPQRFYRVLSP